MTRIARAVIVKIPIKIYESLQLVAYVAEFFLVKTLLGLLLVRRQRNLSGFYIMITPNNFRSFLPGHGPFAGIKNIKLNEMFYLTYSIFFDEHDKL